MAARKKRETFADRLRALREVAGISQYRLAKLSGLSKQAVSYLESGQYQPSWETVQALAKALGVTCEAFVVDDDDQGEAPVEEAEPTPAPKKPKGKGK